MESKMPVYIFDDAGCTEMTIDIAKMSTEILG